MGSWGHDTLMPNPQTARSPSRSEELPTTSSKNEHTACNGTMARASSRLGPPVKILQNWLAINKPEPYAGTYMVQQQVAEQVLHITQGTLSEYTWIPPKTPPTLSCSSNSLLSTSSADHISVALSPTASRFKDIPSISPELRDPFQAWLYILLQVFTPKNNFEIVAYEGTGVLVVYHTMRYEKGSKKWTKKAEMFVVRCYSEVAARAQFEGMRTTVNVYAGEQADLYRPGKQWLTTYLHALHTGQGWDERNGPRSPAPNVFAGVAVGARVEFARWVQNTPSQVTTGLVPLDFVGMFNKLDLETWHIEADCRAIQEIFGLMDEKHFG